MGLLKGLQVGLLKVQKVKALMQNVSFKVFKCIKINVQYLIKIKHFLISYIFSYLDTFPVFSAFLLFSRKIITLYCHFMCLIIFTSGEKKSPYALARVWCRAAGKESLQSEGREFCMVDSPCCTAETIS